MANFFCNQIFAFGLAILDFQNAASSILAKSGNIANFRNLICFVVAKMNRVFGHEGNKAGFECLSNAFILFHNPHRNKDN